MHSSHWNNSLIWIILHFAIFFKHSVCRYGLLNFCTYLDTCTMCFFFHPAFPPLVFSGWPWRQSPDQDTPALALPSAQLAHIKSNQPQHKSPLLLSFCPSCWVLVVFLTGPLRIRCVFTFWFSDCFWIFLFLLWVLDHGLGNFCGIVWANLSFYLLSVPRCPLFNQLSLLSLFSLLQSVQPCSSVL